MPVLAILGAAALFGLGYYLSRGGSIPTTRTGVTLPERTVTRGSDAPYGTTTRIVTDASSGEDALSHFERTLRRRDRGAVVGQATGVTPGVVNITSAAPSLRIEVDGRYAGTTPLDLELEAGPHVIVATQPLKGGAQRFIGRSEIVMPPGSTVSLPLHFSGR